VATTRLFPYDPPAPAEPSPKERIRDAALSCFAVRGIAATTLRAVAETAEVSIGLVQHHFRTKAALTAAVDQYVLQVVGGALQHTRLPPFDGLNEAGRRLTALMIERPDVMTYLGRAVAEGGALGSVIFTGLWKSVQGRVTSSCNRAASDPISIPIGQYSTRSFCASARSFCTPTSSST
jgi:AcrR family transcriptional regulator